VDSQFGDIPELVKLGASRSREWLQHAIALLDQAVHQLHQPGHAARGAILEATSLLRREIEPKPAGDGTGQKGRLLAWQARKVREYIDSHLTSRVLVADLCALVQRSEAHFSRTFKCTFGESPHAYVVRRRLECAARYMIQTDATLSDIALRCGFADQPHMCKHFRQATGQTPAAWRRSRSTLDDDKEVDTSNGSELAA